MPNYNTILSSEEIEFLLDYLDPVLDDEDDGKMAFSISRKLQNIKKQSDEYLR